MMRAIEEDLHAQVQQLLLPSLYLKAHLYRRSKHAPEHSGCDGLFPFLTDAYFEALVHHRIQQRASYLHRALSSLRAQHAHITSTFLLQSPRWIGLRTLNSETHNGACSPLFVTYEDGRCLVYRPHNVEIFGFLHQALALALPQFQSIVPQSMPLDSQSGCVQYIQHESATDLPGYYYAFGVLVALAYFFRLTDLHFENIVVSQNCPVVVDLELLAHVYGDDHRVDDTGLIGESPYSALTGGGILWSTSPHAHASQERLSYRKRVFWNQNHATVDNPTQSAFRHQEVLIDGFVEASLQLMKWKSSLLELCHTMGPRLRSRQLLRPTYYYTLLMIQFLQPDLWSLENHRLRLYQQLFEVPRMLSPGDLRPVNFEFYDLSHGDVPYFFMPLAETTLHHHSGATLPHYVPASPLAALLPWLNTRTVVHIHEQARRLRADRAAPS